MDSIPINGLTPDFAPPSDKSIRAIVTLSWPYSSSTKQCALLLADLDFRLRNRKGQVRTRFTGASAEAVAKSHVGIGDEIVLSLEGASWEQDPEASRTPGKSVDGELMFRRRLVLNVKRSDGDVNINVDAPVSPVRSPQKIVEIATPLPKTITTLQSTFDGAADSLSSYTYTSPAFVKRLRLSGESLLDSAWDPFAGDDTALETWNERKRSSFGSNLRWRVAEKTPSPKKVHFPDDVSAAQEQRDEPELPQVEESRSGSPSKNTRSKTRMLPPPLPHLEMPATKPVDDSTLVEQESASNTAEEGPSTPKIRPVQSPTLPLPSPFPIETRSVQFGLVGDTTIPQNQSHAGPLDMTGETLTEIERGSAFDEKHTQDVQMLDAGVGKSEETLVEDNESDEGPIQLGQVQEPGVVLSGEIATPQQKDSQIIEDSAVILPDHRIAEIAEQSIVDRPEHLILEAPQTPVKEYTLTQQIAHGLDGATSAPPSAHVTPQSEKEKIMAQTYRSLFGFQEAATVGPPVAHSEPQQDNSESSKGTVWFSDVAKDRVEPTHTPLVDIQDQPTEVTEQASAPQLRERAQGEVEQLQYEDIQQPSKEPAPEAQIEVVDLASSSESEDERPKEVNPSRPAPQRRVPKLEMQDSLADPEGENLLAQDSEARRGLSGVYERRKQASRLQDMVAKEPSQAPDDRVEPFEAVAPDATRREETGIKSLHEEPVVSDRALAVPAVQTYSRQTSPPLDFSEFLTSPTTNLPVSQHGIDSESAVFPWPQSSSIEYTEIPASSLGQTRVQQVPNEIAENMEVEFPLMAETENEQVLLESIAPTNLIEIDTLSPLRPEETDVLGSQVAENKVGETPTEMLQNDLASPVDFEQLPTSPVPGPLDKEKSQSSLVESPTEPTFAGNRERSTQVPDLTLHTPSYPRLPLSPSNSQSLQDMPLHDAELMLQDTYRSALPPTPQLTQVESTAELEIPPEEPHLVSQAQTQERSPELPMAQEVQQLPQVLDELGVSVPPGSQLENAQEEQPPSQLRTKKAARKSVPSRVSDVPDVISPWFSPKRSSVAGSRRQSTDTCSAEPSRDEVGSEVNVVADTAVAGRQATESVHSLRIATSINGFSTALSYFTPLSRLEEFLNPSSQQGYGTNTIDLIVLVKDRAREPVRAKAGPRDYYTVFKATDYSLSARRNVRVEIYRPFLATLPVAETGDVILLRAFAVKSRKRQPYLLSTDASAWCVWRNVDLAAPEGNTDTRSIWARRGAGSGDGIREEIKGPPVELGEEEREHASRLRDWWQSVGPDTSNHGKDEMLNGGVNGHATKPIAAKL